VIVKDMVEAQRSLGKPVTITSGSLIGRHGTIHSVNMKWAFVRVPGELWATRCEPGDIELDPGV
jgi:membrane protein implicated in regulation of membrane protease activity